MENNKKAFNWKVIAVIGVVLLGLIYLNNKKEEVSQSGDNNDSETEGSTDNGVNSGTPNQPKGISQVKIALLAEPAKDDDIKKVKGCDLVSLVERDIAPTLAPLTASMKELFAKKDTWPYTENSSGSFISSQKDLFFDKAILSNGVAKIYLTGKYSLSGECDDPRIETQIEETAMQFATVKSVEIFLNDKPFVIPSLKGE